MPRRRLTPPAPPPEDGAFAAVLRAMAEADAAGSAAALFAEEPVPLNVFVQDRRYLANPPLSAVQYEAVRHIERVYYPSTYLLLAKEFESGVKPERLSVGYAGSFREELYWSTPVRMCNFITIQWGKGSGKDHIARVALLRIAYLLMCLESPQDYYGMPAQDTIHLLNVASSSAQAQQAFFQPVTRAVKRGWFADRCVPKINVVSFDKNIEAVSGHSDAETQEGLNLMLGIADEIDAFKSKKEIGSRGGAGVREPIKSVEAILGMLRTSGATRFPEVFKNVRISYPRYLGSPIQRLTKEAKADMSSQDIDSRHFVSGPLPTWEVNPRVPGKDAFADDYREDPILARSKYECRPARAINPYFRNHEAVDACFLPVPAPPLCVDYQLEQANTGRAVWVPRYTFDPGLYPVRGAVYAMHADLALTGDRAGLAMAHVVRYAEHESLAEDEEGYTHPIRELRPHIKADFAIGYSADASVHPPREIQIRWARQLCFELMRRGFNIARFTFDMFQSADSMQILSARGIECVRLSTEVSDEPWRNLRDIMYEGRLTVARAADAAEDPAQLLREELLSLTRMPNGRIDHPSDGCFTADTRVPLQDGTVPTIAELEGKAVWVYSATPDGRIVSGLARGRRTKAAKRLVDVVLDSGYVARCTPQHLWMLPDGSYKPAQDLVPGVDRLMPMTRMWPVNGGYERVSDRDGHRNGQEFRTAADANHKVRYVIPVELEHPVPVYDLEVDQWHNFALSGGVFVHNSKDVADALACAVLGAVRCGGQEEEDGARAHFSPAEFAVGRDFEPPLGMATRLGFDTPAVGRW